MSRRDISAILFAGLLLALACGRGEARFGSVEVSSSGHDALLGRLSLDRPVLESATRKALKGVGFKEANPEAGYRVRTRVAQVRVGRSEGMEGVFAELLLEVEMVPQGPRDGTESVAAIGVGEVPAARRLDPSAWRTALDDAARQAAGSLILAHAAEGKTEARLIADLGARDPRLREQAIRVLAGRRSARAVPFLIERLNDPEPDLVERAAGALSQIRDPRAVAALIDLSRRGEDPLQIARFARLIGDIGGSEARGYLQTLESGHQDSRVRAAAAEALEDALSRDEEEQRMAKSAALPAPTEDSAKMSR